MSIVIIEIENRHKFRYNKIITEEYTGTFE